jgi:hypothetical protein
MFGVDIIVLPGILLETESEKYDLLVSGWRETQFFVASYNSPVIIL